MKIKTLLTGAVLGACLLGVVRSDAAAYIKFDGVDGEATDADHKDWINLESMSFVVTRAVDEQTGLPTGRTKPGTFKITKRIDKSTPLLMQALVNNGANPTITIDFTKTYGSKGDAAYLKYELKNVLISSYSISGSADSDAVPTESFTLNFEEIKVTYVPRDTAGRESGAPVDYSWNIDSNTAQ